MKQFLPVRLTRHAHERLNRLYGLGEDSVIRDIKRHIYNVKQERGGLKYKLVGDIAQYIMDKDFKVITIMYCRNRRKRNRKREYMGTQWVNLGKEEIKDRIRLAQARKDKLTNK
jgi:hypothetical protein